MSSQSTDEIMAQKRKVEDFLTTCEKKMSKIEELKTYWVRNRVRRSLYSDVTRLKDMLKEFPADFSTNLLPRVDGMLTGLKIEKKPRTPALFVSEVNTIIVLLSIFSLT